LKARPFKPKLKATNSENTSGVQDAQEEDEKPCDPVNTKSDSIASNLAKEINQNPHEQQYPNESRRKKLYDTKSSQKKCTSISESITTKIVEMYQDIPKTKCSTEEAITEQNVDSMTGCTIFEDWKKPEYRSSKNEAHESPKGTESEVEQQNHCNIPPSFPSIPSNSAYTAAFADQAST
jgi:predicted component of type VI protein secretion system